MSNPAMRTITRLRASHAQYRLQIATPSSLISSRSYSALQPLALTNTTTNPPFPSPSSKRPTPFSRQLPLRRDNNQNSRRFSVLPLFEASIAASQTLLTSLHTLSATPWYLTIPLFALTINLCTRLPTTVYSRGVAVRRQRLTPLMHAWAARVQADHAAAVASGKKAGPGGWTERSVGALGARNVKLLNSRQRRWRVQRWKDWVPSLVVFPVWLVGIEALRRMCGGPRGLLGSLLFGVKEVGGGEGGVAGADAAASATAALVEGAAAVPAVGDQEGWPVQDGLGVDLNSLATEQAEVQGALPSYLADPSMATGGCLWFPDLTVADPQHILPFALSAILVWNVLPKSQTSLRAVLGLDNVPGTLARWPLRLRRGLLMVALVVGPATMDLPAALHLYWISSAVLIWAQTAVISRLMPLPKMVAPAKRGEPVAVMPTRQQPKKP